MKNLLLEGGMGESSWILIVFAVLIVVMFISTIFRNKKANKERVEMMTNIKVGDSIITTAGLFGKVVSMRETTIGRVYVIESGEDKHKSTFEIHADGIMGVDTKKDIVYDANGNDITFAEEDKLEEAKESVVEEKIEEVEEVKEEKPAPKKSSKAKKASK